MNAPIDIAAIQWRNPNADSDSDWHRVETWLGDFGIGFGWQGGCGAYDGQAQLNGDRRAFRIDSVSKGKPASVVLVATIDRDADFDGERYVDRSACMRVEVIRC